MKRSLEVLVGMALIAAAILLAVYVDSGYRPDSMDCGSSALTSWKGECGDSQGSFLLAFLKGAVTLVGGYIGVLLVGGKKLRSKLTLIK